MLRGMWLVLAEIFFGLYICPHPTLSCLGTSATTPAARIKGVPVQRPRVALQPAIVLAPFQLRLQAMTPPICLGAFGLVGAGLLHSPPCTCTSHLSRGLLPRSATFLAIFPSL